jgi:hypothetical protein
VRGGAPSSKRFEVGGSQEEGEKIPAVNKFAALRGDDDDDDDY